MIRSKQIAGRFALALVLAFQSATPAQLVLTSAVATATVTAAACGPNTLEELNTTLNKVAHALEAAADTTDRLYEAGTFGAKGSPGAIEMRQRIGRVIHDSNEALIAALNITKGLTKETFEGSKILILEKLSSAATGLRVGHQTVDLVLQTVATLINQAVALAQLFKASDVKHIKRLIPALDEHLKAFAHIREINISRMEVFAE